MNVDVDVDVDVDVRNLGETVKGAMNWLCYVFWGGFWLYVFKM